MTEIGASTDILISELIDWCGSGADYRDGQQSANSSRSMFSITDIQKAENRR